MILKDVKLPIGYSKEDLYRAAAKKARLPQEKIHTVTVLRRSLDARKKPDLFYVATLLVNEKEQMEEPEKIPLFPGTKPVAVIGAGPAGLFAALTLAECGVPVILLERGRPVEERRKDVERFFEEGVLDPDSNVQFGEGGAGAFSDGKLNTLIKDPGQIGRKVLRVFLDAGAPEEILMDQRPHLGTDKLPGILRNIRERLIRNGVEIRFRTKVKDFCFWDGKLTGLVLETDGKASLLPVEYALLCIGHSARDTYETLFSHGVGMSQKPFAVGVRVEHPQEMITKDRYGENAPEELGAASYKLTAMTDRGRGVYSFCMCPGGYVVNASSEPGLLAVNGMSNYARDGKNANSGIVVQVRPEDFGSDAPLAGIAYQRDLEKKAYEAGAGKIPVQLYGDFAAGRVSRAFGEILPEMKGAYAFADLNGVLPEEVASAIREAMPKFGRTIPGFDRPDAVLSGVESRTSSPVRIERDSEFQANITGLLPVGEGAGYAGGIMSAAIDGIRAAKALLKKIGEKTGI